MQNMRQINMSHPWIDGFMRNIINVFHQIVNPMEEKFLINIKFEATKYTRKKYVMNGSDWNV